VVELMLDTGYWMVVFDEIDYWIRMAFGLVRFWTNRVED